ncbi:MAG: class I SAM-dependent methyltransferase [Deltaproteobacteria bacterium]|nr:class I SAM-dependent methyltransferase [Deltaproteobacteria bacterium]
MGDPTATKGRARILESLSALGILAPDEAVEALSRHANEIVRWSRRVDLTGSATVEAFAAGPLFDALTLVPLLEDEGTLLDVGSGGGLPGIPAAILRPGLKITLCEPRAKRAAFLRHAAALLGLGARVEEARDDALRDRGFDGAMAQAVWPAAKWLLRALLLVRPRGAIYVLSAEALDPAALPPGTAIEMSSSFVRPRDGQRRFAFRVRVDA